MNIKLFRTRIRVNTHSAHFDNTCDGIISIDGQKVCDTAENAKFRVPPGVYNIQLLHHQTWGRKMPTLVQSEDSLSSQLSSINSPVLGIGNGIHTSFDGRILVGKLTAPGVVIKSRDIFMNLYDRINNSLRRGNKVSITITE